jgi:FtsP/CotA-like multicopper oxidase with cupredoxin domain
MEPRRRDLFLKIEPLADPYSPLAPIPCARKYGRDCMYGMGHELGRVTRDEIFATTLDPLVFHEYLDPHYILPNTSKLVQADVNEPPWANRVPGAVLYAQPGERLFIHVLNGDPKDCHSFHVHGVRYGIDSDGAWPFGIANKAGRRSDEIKPGERWTYVFDVTSETIGAWPFHDHAHDVQRNINRGLFGALIVRDPAVPCPDHEIPMFIHQVAGGTTGSQFESPLLQPNNVGAASVFQHQFTAGPETCQYHCAIHGILMSGTVEVVPGGPTATPVDVTALDNRWVPQVVQVGPGGTVRWTNKGANPHIVLATGGGAPVYCLNGRAFVGNTPTIEVRPNDRLRWYVFNLDVGEVWHNFHPHAGRWQIPSPPGGAADVHSLSPVESFVTDTLGPEALRLPCELEELQCDPPEDACRVQIKGEFLFHCHLESHMMAGLAGLVRSRQWIWLTADAADALSLQIPYDDGANSCPHVDLMRCAPEPPPQRPPKGRPEQPGRPPTTARRSASPVAGAQMTSMSIASAMPMAGRMVGMMPLPGGIAGTMPAGGMGAAAAAMGGLDLTKAATDGAWELLPCDSQVLAVHAALLHTGKVLFVSGSGNDTANVPTKNFRTVVWDYKGGGFKTVHTPSDVFCSGHAFMPDGRVLVAGGTERYATATTGFRGAKDAYLFDPILEDYIKLGSMHDGRWYPSLVAQPDGSVVAISGLRFNLASNGASLLNPLIERFSYAKGWEQLGGNTEFPLYPHVFVLSGSRMMYDGGHVFGSAGLPPGRLTLPHTFTPLPTPLPPNFLLDQRDQSSSVILPPAQDQKLMLMGGGDPAIDSVDIIDMRAANPTFKAAASLKKARMHLNAVVLPDRTVFVCGGNTGGEAIPSAVYEGEIYEPTTNKWRIVAKAEVPRLYHSVALLLPDGRVITAGSNPEAVAGGELRLELYHPPYLFQGARPFITGAPVEVHYGDTIEIETPQAREIMWAELIRPTATTHSWAMEQRLIDLPIERKRDLCRLRARLPRDPSLATPGWYMLFLVNRDRVPSVARWVHLSAPVRMTAVAMQVRSALRPAHLVADPSGLIAWPGQAVSKGGRPTKSSRPRATVSSQPRESDAKRPSARRRLARSPRTESER